MSHLKVRDLLMHLTSEEATLIANGMRLAAEEYERIAGELAADGMSPASLVDQFKRQAELATFISEDAENISGGLSCRQSIGLTPYQRAASGGDGGL